VRSHRDLNLPSMNDSGVNRPKNVARSKVRCEDSVTRAMGMMPIARGGFLDVIRTAQQAMKGVQRARKKTILLHLDIEKAPNSVPAAGKPSRVTAS